MRQTEKFLLQLGDYHILNINGKEATSSQIYSLWSFMNMLPHAVSKNIFARGESDKNLRKHYLTDTTNISLLLDTIFCIGEKGRVCLDDNNWIDPDDITAKNFTIICTLLRSVLESADKGSPGRVERMREFIRRNTSFHKAFTNDINNVVSNYTRLSSQKRAAVNIYYLSILHTINSYSYKDQSIFVSTSQDFEIAEQFEQTLLLIGWIPTQPK